MFATIVLAAPLRSHLAPRPVRATRCMSSPHDVFAPKFVREFSETIRRDRADRKEAARKVFDACKAFGKDDLNSVIGLHKGMAMDLGIFSDRSDFDGAWTPKTDHHDPEPANEPDFAVVDVFDTDEYE
jgi:hypothetical protein